MASLARRIKWIVKERREALVENASIGKYSDATIRARAIKWPSATREGVG